MAAHSGSDRSLTKMSISGMNSLPSRSVMSRTYITRRSQKAICASTMATVQCSPTGCCSSSSLRRAANVRMRWVEARLRSTNDRSSVMWKSSRDETFDFSLPQNRSSGIRSHTSLDVSDGLSVLFEENAVDAELARSSDVGLPIIHEDHLARLHTQSFADQSIDAWIG